MADDRDARRFRAVKVRGIRSVGYRIVVQDYRRQVLSLEGSLRFGGRYNPPFEFGALYLGLSRETCWAELARKHEGPLRRAAFHLATLTVRLQRVLDLTDPTVCRQLGIDPAMLVQPADYTLTRSIARAARENGFEAILAPSAAGTGPILSIFTDRLAPGSHVIPSTRTRRAFPRQ